MVNFKHRKLAELKPFDNNPRTIADEDLSVLCESIISNPIYFEARPLILSDRTGELVIIAGNQRYRAAKKLNLKEVPTYLIQGLTEEKEKVKEVNEVAKKYDKKPEPEELLKLKHITGYSKLFKDVKYNKMWESPKQIKLRNNLTVKK